jgi:hypothetical protein
MTGLVDADMLRSFSESTDAGGNLFTSPEWCEVMRETYGFDYVAPAAGGALPPAALIADTLGKRMVLPAFGDYALRNPGPGLADEIESLRIGCGSAALTVKVAGETDLPSERIVRRALLHEIDPQDYEVSSSFARNVGEAKAAGITLEQRTDAEAMDIFYPLYARQRIRKFNSLPQPIAFFRNIARRFFPDRGFVLFALSADRPVAALVVLRHENVLYHKFSASDPDSLKLRPNNLALGRLIEIAAEEGAERLDLGMTPGEGGLAFFKRSMGAREMPCHTYRWPALDGGGENAAKWEQEKRALIAEITASLVASDPAPEVASEYGRAFYRYFA